MFSRPWGCTCSRAPIAPLWLCLWYSWVSCSFGHWAVCLGSRLTVVAYVIRFKGCREDGADEFYSCVLCSVIDDTSAIPLQLLLLRRWKVRLLFASSYASRLNPYMNRSLQRAYRHSTSPYALYLPWKGSIRLCSGYAELKLSSAVWTWFSRVDCVGSAVLPADDWRSCRVLCVFHPIR